MIIGTNPNIEVDVIIITGSVVLSFVLCFEFIFLLVSKILNEIFK